MISEFSPSAAPAGAVPRIGVVALEDGPCILASEFRGNLALPGLPIANEHITLSECHAALGPFAEIPHMQGVRIERVTEFHHLWNGASAHLIVYVVKRVQLLTRNLHRGATWLDLSRANSSQSFEPSILKLMAARSHTRPVPTAA